MSYRFQKFTTVYPAFLKQFLADNSGYERLSYGELYDRFVGTRCGWANFFANHLQALGNEAQDLFASVEPLQKAWARENGVRYGEETWVRDIVLAQVKAFRPEVLFLQDLYLFDHDYRQQLRAACGGRVLLLGWRAAPTQDFGAFSDLDVVLTCVPNFVESLRRHGANAMLLPMAFEVTTLGAAAVAERELDFTFAGSLGPPTAITPSATPSSNSSSAPPRYRSGVMLAGRRRGLAPTAFSTGSGMGRTRC